MSDKRQRLLDAALRLAHESGLSRTTLARIAEESKVPLGNIYYYFRTKEALWRAVIEVRRGQVEQVLARAATAPDPKAQLLALTEYFLEAGDEISRFGCPFGGLCHDLSQEEGVDPELRAAPLATLLDWADERFQTLGQPKKEARRLAGHLVAGIQGGALLAHAMADPKLLRREIRFLQRWIETV